MQNRLTSICFLFLLLSCGTTEKEYIYPVSNPYPELFTSVYSDNLELLKTSVKSSTIDFECTKRIDQPYYWCGIDGNFSKPIAPLPKRLETIFHVQIPKWAANNVKKLLKNNKNKELKLIIHQNPSIDKDRDIIWSQLFAFYNNEFCVAFLGREDLCPNKKNIKNIYLKR